MITCSTTNGLKPGPFSMSRSSAISSWEKIDLSRLCSGEWTKQKTRPSTTHLGWYITSTRTLEELSPSKRPTTSMHIFERNHQALRKHARGWFKSARPRIVVGFASSGKRRAPSSGRAHPRSIAEYPPHGTAVDLQYG